MKNFSYLFVDFKRFIRLLDRHEGISKENIILWRWILVHDLPETLDVHPLVLPKMNLKNNLFDELCSNGISKPVIKVYLCHFLLRLNKVGLFRPNGSQDIEGRLRVPLFERKVSVCHSDPYFLASSLRCRELL